MGWAQAQDAEAPEDARARREREALASLLAPLLAEPTQAGELATRLLHRCGGFATVLRTPGPLLLDAAPGLPPAAIAVFGRLGEVSASLARASAVAAPGRAGAGRQGAAATTTGGAVPAASRLAAGRWLRRMREAAALTQAELAARLGCPSPTLVDQIEAGHGRIAWSRAGAWADALGVARPDFAAGLVWYYEPELAALLNRRPPCAPADASAAAPEEADQDTAA